MAAANTGHAWDFFRIAGIALFNDMIAHVIKVLDRNQQSASFWYVFRCLESTLRPALEKAGVTIDEIERLADRLKDIRDQTLFHIDRDYEPIHGSAPDIAGHDPVRGAAVLLVRYGRRAPRCRESGTRP